jgi:hypothetical protein
VELQWVEGTETLLLGEVVGRIGLVAVRGWWWNA